MLLKLRAARPEAAEMNPYIVVSGLPASGKSTLARALAAALGLPAIDKDDFLEALFGLGVGGGAARRRQLSREADEQFRRRTEHVGGAVLASWWKHPRSDIDSGTPTDWLKDLPGRVLEIHCRCEPGVAASRFMSRRRHLGHGDDRWSRPRLLANFSQQYLLGPLGLFPLITVQTDIELELDSLMSSVSGFLE